MALGALPALGVQNPPINALGAFVAGTEARQGVEANKIALARQKIETVGSVALGAMGGDLNGQVNPQIYEQGLDMLESEGFDVSSYRGKPEFAPVAARASMSALQQLSNDMDERQFEQTLTAFQSDLQQNAITNNQNERRLAIAETPTAPTAPSGYQWTDDTATAQQPIPGGPADKPASDRELSAGEKKELFEAQDQVTAGGYVLDALKEAQNLNASAVDGAFAGQRAWLGANIPDVGLGNGDEQDQATIRYQNIVTELALNQLKSVFGATPTEGERKILLEIQGSVDQPREVRTEILKRAEEMAVRRVADAQAKADGIRTGAYLQPGFTTQQPAATLPALAAPGTAPSESERRTVNGVIYEKDASGDWFEVQ